VKQDPDNDLFFVVGPSLVLSGAHEAGLDQMTLDVIRGAERLGNLESRISGQRITIRASRDLLGAATPHELAEAIRLFIRVLVKRYRGRFGSFLLASDAVLPRRALELLAADGFGTEPCAAAVPSDRVIYVREQHERVETMEEVYIDPFTIPWNFVPVELDALNPLLSGLAAGGRILDLGCGFGKNAQFLASCGCDVWGVDISLTAVSRARSVAQGCRGFVVASASQLPWPSRTFDAVIDVGCLHCMPADERRVAVGEIARVLRPGGCLYSRIFRPRLSDWLAVQPFKASTFGLEPAAAEELLRTAFCTVDVTSTQDISYLTAREPSP
jgi:2-polyprenyl-3-methyl-5-hydroxy-6-metoxy-1,4-benzoquinol methylase